MALVCLSEERIRNGIAKLRKSKEGGVQGRLDTFFKVVPKTEEQLASSAKKRKARFPHSTLDQMMGD